MGDFQNNEKLSQRFLRLYGENMVFNEVVVWRGSTMLLLNHKASYVCKLLSLK